MVSKRQSRKHRITMLQQDDDGTKYFNTRLVSMIRERDYEAHMILQYNNPVNLVDSSGLTLLHIAAECGNDSIIQHLIDLGCDIDAQDNIGRTPLLLAVSGMHEMSVKILLKSKASIDIADALDRNPFQLTLASYSMRSGATCMFLQRIKDDCRGDGEAIARTLVKANCPLCRAMYLDDLDVIRMMIELGSDVNSKSYEIGLTPLYAAVERNDLEAVKLLVKHGADLQMEDFFGRPALFYTYFDREHSQRKLEIIKILVDGGVRYKMYNYTTVLQFGDRAVVKAILESNIDMYAKDEVHGNTALHYLAENKNPGVIEELNGKSFDINARDMYGNSALLVAASAGISRTVEYLLERGADTNLAHYRFGYTALYKAFVNCTIAAHGEYKRIIEVLLKYGADAQVKTNSPNELFSVIDVAIRKCRFILAEMVVAHLALLEAQGSEIIDEFIVARIESHPRLRMFLRMCRKRLENMKSIVVCGYVTLFHFLTASDEKIVMYARNAELIRKLKIVIGKNNSRSSYCSKLRERVALANKQAKANNKGMVFLAKLMGLSIESHSVIMDKILGLMSSQDIERLVFQLRDDISRIL